MNADIEFILNSADAYCAAKGMKLSTLARIIVNDGKFFKRLKGGANCRTDTCDKVKSWFLQHMPKISKQKQKPPPNS